ncbi:conserved hypothetical protein [Paraburkholderia tropica]|uniref:hypothetical protein n=1 Tax=Paraburkholderia tropica TaxID=92647 RepID=UPI001CB18CCF|nr:hypothetical protein [Paraburkholderia tropica]CAG9217761.1 conserved hypothetical protein [Paraburkholderia tropica]
MSASDDASDVPLDFPRRTTHGVVAGIQPKVCAVLSKGRYVAEQTDREREERWEICEDLAHQLVPKAQEDAAAHPNHDANTTLVRVRDAVARKSWVSSDELNWLMARLRALLEW